MRRPRITHRLLLLACASTGAAALSAALAADAPAPTPKVTVVVPATVEAFEQTDMYAKAAGYVASVDADIGDRVKAGQVMAVIDDPELDRDLVEAKATLAAKRKLLDAANAATRQARTSLDVARRQLTRFQADAKFQDVTLKRQEELFTGKAITDQQLDDARNKAAVAAADVGVAEAKAAAAEADVVGADANRDVAAAQVAVAEAQVEKMTALVQYTKITAPYDAVVTRRNANRGDLVQAATASRTGAPLFTVQRLDSVRVFCDVPETQASAVNVGTPASVKIYGGSDAIAAKVTRLAGALNPETRTMRVEVDLPNDAGKLLPGSYAQVTLTPEQ